MLAPSAHIADVRSRANAVASSLALALVGATLAVSCIHDRRDINAAVAKPEIAPTGMTAETWGVCGLVGHLHDATGVYGTDLGFTVREPGTDRLGMLFGDTWAKPGDACKYPVLGSDDLYATLPATRPAVLRPGAPNGRDEAACKSLDVVHGDPKDVTTWPRIRLYAAAGDKEPLDMGLLRTPVAVFGDGKNVFSIFIRSDPAYCKGSNECPAGMQCTSDAGYHGKSLGTCDQPMKATPDAAPNFCRDASDCGSLLKCNPTKDQGVCVATDPFVVKTRSGPVSPDWYRDDPRRGMAQVMYVGERLSPERPSDYSVVARFRTNRFVDVTARTVAHFEPDHPEHNDYRPGFDAVLVFGRPAFFATGGAQSLPFLFYQKLDALGGDPAKIDFHPHFFAGYDARGGPRWSDDERDAAPIYGGAAKVHDENDAGMRVEWAEPEFDYVGQMSVSYLAPFGRWVMFYGGDIPAFMIADPKTGKAYNATHLERSPGAIHFRTARHPWGQRTSDAPDDERWTSAEPVLKRRTAAPFLACGDGGEKELPGCLENGDPHNVFDLLGTLGRLSTHSTPGKFLDVTGDCLGGQVALAAQDSMSGNSVGRLYAPNIIDEWTIDVTDQVGYLRAGERAVDVFWNVSTWNPYRVALMKTELRATPSR